MEHGKRDKRQTANDWKTDMTKERHTIQSHKIFATVVESDNKQKHKKITQGFDNERCRWLILGIRQDYIYTV